MPPPPPPPGLLLRRIRYTTVCSREGGKEGGFLHCAILPLLFRPGKREKSYREKGGGKLVAVEEEKREDDDDDDDPWDEGKRER